MAKIYLSGRVIGSYRSQVIIETLLARNHDFYYLNGDRFCLFGLAWTSLAMRLLRRIARWGGYIFSLPLRFMLIACSDTVYVLPMSQGGKEVFADQLFARMLRKRVIAEVYFTHYDSKVFDRKVVRENTLKAIAIKKLDNLHFSLCTDLIFLNQSEHAYYSFLHDFSFSKLKTHFMPLVVPRRDKAALPFFYDVSRTLNLVWWGTYIPLHGLEKLIVAASKLKQNQLNFHFYIFGNSESKSESYRLLVAKYDLGDLVTIRNDATFNNGLLPQFLLEHADISFGHFGDSGKANTVICNKVLDSMAMGLPVISMPSKATLELLEPGKDIFTCNNSPDAIADTVMELATSPAEVKTCADRGRLTHMNKFTPEHYRQFLCDLVEG